jgi:membrane associated rhomboid family serine protease
MEPTLISIPARSRRQAMEWGLVLASQGMEAVVDRSDEGWALLVEPREYDRALANLNLYQLENRGWQWRQPLPEAGVLFHWGGLGWAASIVAVYYWSAVRFPGVRAAGILDSEKVRQGQWWRLWTAITLHENMPHLMANATTGLILMGLAMARYGAGVALLAAFVAGAVGNVASLLGYAQPHQSLGASGMVMGALGLVTVQSFSLWRAFPFGRRLFFRALAAGVLILALIGFNPEADIIAHVGGFIAGAAFGCALGCAPPARLQRGPANAGALLALAGLLLATWRLALRPP